MITAQSLRDQKFKVIIRHTRWFKDVCVVESTLGPPPERHYNLMGLMTKGEFERYKTDGRLSLSPFANADEFSNDDIGNFGEEVSPKGGFTTATIVTPTGEEYVGKFNFTNRAFNKRIGILAAFGRAMKSYLQTNENKPLDEKPAKQKSFRELVRERIQKLDKPAGE